MVRKKQATIRAAAKHKQSRREQLARARKHRKVEQLGCTDAELRQQSGGVEDESSTSTAGSCDTFLGGNTLSQFKTETYQAISAQNSAERFLLMHRTTRQFLNQLQLQKWLLLTSVNFAHLSELLAALSASKTPFL